MMKNKKPGVFVSILRYTSIVLMSLTAVFTVMSGVGTSCVALAAEKFGAMAVLAPYQWVYISFVIITTAIGILGIRAVILLILGRENGYRASLSALIPGIIIGVIHMIVSRSLRGSSMPVDGVVYTTTLTLLVFLIYRLPGVRDNIEIRNKEQSQSRISGGMSAIIVSAFLLSIQFLMAPTHTIQGTNYANAFETSLLTAGLSTAAGGLSLLVWEALSSIPEKGAGYAQKQHK